MAQIIDKMMSKFVKWADPKLEKYRPKKKPVPYVPKNRRDFDALLKRTPEEILNQRTKNLIEIFDVLDEVDVREIMQPRKTMPVLRESDQLSLFTLSRLAKTKAKYYPVLSRDNQIRGYLHADAFDISKISEDSSIDPYLDTNILYVRPEYTVEQLMSAFSRSGLCYALVIDNGMHLVGDITLERALNQIFGFKSDDFCADMDILSVSNRKF